MIAMKIGWALALMMAALPVRAEPPDKQDQLAWHQFQLAVAEAEGDAHTDLLVLRSMSTLAEASADPAASDELRALGARAQVVQAELQARIDAARDSDPYLLAADLGCWPDRTSATCVERRARLETHAADNAYFGVLLMSLAWAAGDAEGYLRAARLAASADRYDSLPSVPFGALRARYRSVPVPRMTGMDEQAMRHAPDNLAMAITAAIATPPLQHFANSCKAAEDELGTQCLAIAKRMQANSRGLLELWLAQIVIEAQGTPMDVERALSMRREADWLRTRAAELMWAAEKVPVAGTEEYFDAFAAAGEFEAMRVLLRTHRIPTTPPAGWVMPQRQPAPAQ